MSLPKELKEALDIELDDEYIAKKEESCHSYDELIKSIQDDESEDSLPSDYGGCYIDTNGELNVLVCSKEDSAKNKYKDRIADDNIKIKEVKYSKNYLNGFMDVINAYLLQHTGGGIAFYNTGSSLPTVGIVKSNQGNHSYFVKAGQINSAFGLSRY